MVYDKKQSLKTLFTIRRIMGVYSFAEFLLSKAITAGITFFVGFIVARFSNKLVKLLLHELELDIFFRKLGYTFSIEDFLSGIIEFLVYSATVLFVLYQLGILEIILALILVFVILFLLASSFLSFRDAVPNFFARLFLTHIKSGSLVAVMGLKGRLERIGLFQTKIINERNESIFVPNSLMIKCAVKKN